MTTVADNTLTFAERLAKEAARRMWKNVYGSEAEILADLAPLFTECAQQAADAQRRAAQPVSPVSVTDRARQLLRREGFVKGCQHACLFPEQRTTEQFKQAARDAFPLPTIRRPLRVTFSTGTTFAYDPSSLSPPNYCFAAFVGDVIRGWHPLIAMSQFVKTHDDYAKLARILSGEMEEVPDDGSAVAEGDDA